MKIDNVVAAIWREPAFFLGFSVLALICLFCLVYPFAPLKWDAWLSQINLTVELAPMTSLAPKVMIFLTGLGGLCLIGIFAWFVVQPEEKKDRADPWGIDGEITIMIGEEEWEQLDW